MAGVSWLDHGGGPVQSVPEGLPPPAEPIGVDGSAAAPAKRHRLRVMVGEGRSSPSPDLPGFEGEVRFRAEPSDRKWQPRYLYIFEGSTDLLIYKSRVKAMKGGTPDDTRSLVGATLDGLDPRIKLHKDHSDGFVLVTPDSQGSASCSAKWLSFCTPSTAVAADFKAAIESAAGPHEIVREGKMWLKGRLPDVRKENGPFVVQLKAAGTDGWSASSVVYYTETNTQRHLQGGICFADHVSTWIGDGECVTPFSFYFMRCKQGRGPCLVFLEAATLILVFSHCSGFSQG